ncbi:multidrug transporter [Lojkania enalia]|uniref:Multidrug transporter n=1 Tax=Lojkania enalia TaxID=147567 RepID=A0A9P4JZI1_9PLEO|nr:multidrug transporter [Didymosphaeria enalia]
MLPSVDLNRTSIAEKKYESSEDGSHGPRLPTANDSIQHMDTAGSISDEDRRFYYKFGTYDRYEITEENCYEELGFCFPTVIFLVQVSMNFNTSLYSNTISGISDEFGVSDQAERVGAAIFLIPYTYGCELWAPWSEEVGRWPVMQLSLFLVNIWQTPVGVAPNFGTMIVYRTLGGLYSAGGSITLGMVADMWEADTQQYAAAYVVYYSVGGSIFGPIVGGFIEQFLVWRWNIWIQLIFDGFVQALHFVLVPVTRTTIMMDKIAKNRRKEAEEGRKPVNIWGPNELTPFKDRFSAREVLITWIRPFRMFLTEPIACALVYAQWNLATFAIGLAFVPIGIGYFLAWFSFFPTIHHNKQTRRECPNDERAQYESRLWWLLYTAPCLPIGLIAFAWTSTGPPVHWVGSMVFSAVIGIANYAIYMATVDYMICAYGPYSASATGGTGWSRDFLAGVLTLPATPFYQNIPSSSNRWHLAYASTILFCIATLLVVVVYVIYWKGPVLRKRSPFAQQLSQAREETGGRRASALPGIYGSRHNSIVAGTSVPGWRRGSVLRSTGPSQVQPRVAR